MIRRFPIQRALLGLLCVTGLLGLVRDAAGQAARSGTQPGSQREGHRLTVSLPIDDLSSRQLRQQLQQIADQAPPVVRPADRPVVILEFDTRTGKTGRGSELEACQALARFLTSADLNAIETVAYVPALQGILPAPAADTARLSGHAVLVAIAANQLALEPQVLLGEAGVDESTIDPLVETVYRTVAQKRLQLPLPVVMSMLDADAGLYRVRNADQSVEYLNHIQLAERESRGVPLLETRTLAAPGTSALLSSDQLAELRLLSLEIRDLEELARRLNVASGSLQGEPGLAGDWQAIEVPLPFSIDPQTQRWLSRNINREVNRGANLVILRFDDNLGSLEPCLEIAGQIAELRERGVRTAAHVRGRLTGPVGLMALACDDLLMDPEARLGGFPEEGDPELSPAEVEKWTDTLRSLAARSDREWSLMLALLDPSLAVSRYRNSQSGRIRLMTNEEVRQLPDLDQWEALGPIGLSAGLGAAEAERLGLARAVVSDPGQIQQYYQLTEPPPQLELTDAERWLEDLAAFLRHPLVTILLIWGAFFFISTEFQAPGLGLPGFLGTLCIALFFWSNWLGGNAEWFELLMFILGVAFLLLELFVVPGLGVFGIGGVLLLITSLILMGQDFVFPTTGAQIRQLPRSMLPVVGGTLGLVAAGFVLRRALPHSPYLNRLLIQRRPRDETGLSGNRDPEATADWSFLNGRSGQAITRLNPAGKARIGNHIVDVISTGQLVDKGTAITVVEAVANRVVVQPAVESDADADAG